VVIFHITPMSLGISLYALVDLGLYSRTATMTLSSSYGLRDEQQNIFMLSVYMTLQPSSTAFFHIFPVEEASQSLSLWKFLLVRIGCLTSDRRVTLMRYTYQASAMFIMDSMLSMHDIQSVHK